MKKEKKAATGAAEEVLEQSPASEESPRRRLNNVRKIRESLLLSKAELARKAGLSALTIDRIESGYECRMDTKRKIILALGMKVSDKDQVFGEPNPEPER